LRPRTTGFRIGFEQVVRRLRKGFVGACLERAIAINAVQRATVLASQAFTAGIPFVIVVSALAPRGREVADSLIRRFHLKGTTADQVRALFLSRSDVRGGVTWVGVVFLIGSAIALAGTLQVVYERALTIPHGGIRARWRTVIWVLGTAAYIEWFVQLRPSVYTGAANLALALLSILGSVVYWLWTPRILIGPRVSWRRLLPIAGLTTIAVTILTLSSPAYMPTMIRDEAARFGMIGAAFALLSWLVVLAFLVVGSAVVATQRDEWQLVRERAAEASGRIEALAGGRDASAGLREDAGADPRRGA